ncbi:MAG: hypothetical protein IPP91_15695 [Betaproteobacteria bacterium]|nr:hypothetical protein [Betaproteobacteria bacterium]
MLLAVIAGAVVIGATAPERQLMTTNCAVDTSATGTLSDAMLEIASVCPGATKGAEESAPAGANHGVPDAGSSLDPRSDVEVQPPTF